MKWKYCSYKTLLNFFFFTYCKTPGRRLYIHHTKNILLFYLYFRQREWLGWVWQENLFVGSRHSMLTFIGQAWDFPSTLSSIMGVILFVHKCVKVCHYVLDCVNVFACVFARVMILCMYVGWFVHHYDSNNWLDSSEWFAYWTKIKDWFMCRKTWRIKVIIYKYFFLILWKCIS